MKVKNTHSAGISLPGGIDLAPGVHDVDDAKMQKAMEHPVVQSFFKAGYLVEQKAAPAAAPAKEPVRTPLVDLADPRMGEPAPEPEKGSRRRREG